MNTSPGTRVRARAYVVRGQRELEGRTGSIAVVAEAQRGSRGRIPVIWDGLDGLWYYPASGLKEARDSLPGPAVRPGSIAAVLVTRHELADGSDREPHDVSHEDPAASEPPDPFAVANRNREELARRMAEGHAAGEHEGPGRLLHCQACQSQAEPKVFEISITWDDHGDDEVHRTGCQHLKKLRRDGGDYTMTARSRLEVVADFWEDQIREAEAKPEEYLHYMRFAPCLRDLPETV